MHGYRTSSGLAWAIWASGLAEEPLPIASLPIANSQVHSPHWAHSLLTLEEEGWAGLPHLPST